MLRGRLQSLGFAPLYDGLWVSPHAPDNELDIALQIAPAQSCTVIRATELPTRTRLAVASAWNLDELGASYAEFIRTFRPVLRRLQQWPNQFRPRRWSVAPGRTIAGSCSRLPIQICPKRCCRGRWPRAAAHDLFVGLVDGLATLAVERVREIVSKYDRDLGKLVRLRPVGSEPLDSDDIIVTS